MGNASAWSVYIALVPNADAGRTIFCLRHAEFADMSSERLAIHCIRCSLAFNANYKLCNISDVWRTAGAGSPLACS